MPVVNVDPTGEVCDNIDNTVMVLMTPEISVVLT